MMEQLNGHKAIVANSVGMALALRGTGRANAPAAVRARDDKAVGRLEAKLQSAEYALTGRGAPFTGTVFVLLRAAGSADCKAVVYFFSLSLLHLVCMVASPAIS